MPTDSFDDLIDDVVNEDRRPKPAPLEAPPGMVGTAPVRTHSKPARTPAAKPPAARTAHRLMPPVRLATAAWYQWIGVINIGCGAIGAVRLSDDLLESFVWLAFAVAVGMSLIAVSIALDRVNAIAHYAQQTAEKLYEH